MAAETIITNGFEGLIKGLIGAIAALGGVVFLYLIFNIINFYINRKRVLELKKMNLKIDEILNVLKGKKISKK